MSQSTNIFSPKLAKASANQIDKKQWRNLVGSSQTLAIYHAAKNADHLLLVVTPDTQSALKLEHELASINEAQITIELFPDWETLPYDNFSPHQDIISQRLATLYRLPRLSKGIVIVPVATLLQRLAPRAYLEANSFVARVGERKNLHLFRQELEASGYRNVEQVMEHGEYSSRGALIDVYPMGSSSPYRLDYFDDELESIRLFDPETQRSTDKVDNIELLPAREFPTDEAAINLFRQQFRDQLKPSNDKGSIYHLVSKSSFPPGIEYYLPLFFEDTATFFDFVPQTAQLIFCGELQRAIGQTWQDINNRYEDRRYDPLRPLLSPNKLFLEENELFGAFNKHSQIKLVAGQNDIKSSDYVFSSEKLPELTINHQLKNPFSLLNDFIEQCHCEKIKVVFIAESQGRREALIELLKRADYQPTITEQLSQALVNHEPLQLCVSGLSQGFLAPDTKLAIITESDLLGDHVRQTRRRNKQQQTNADALFKNLAELSIGQPVVHIDHGIGRYQGLQTIENAGLATEFLVLSYANDAKLYVPVSSLHMISRYSGNSEESAPLNKLGNDTWSKAKKKAAEKIRDVAAELLDVYAQRANSKGHQFTRDKKEYIQFCDSFGFEETIDQENAINAVVGDMLDKKTMDRLVCGDVGFGKTEVAMRAAFVAVNDNKQVAILVPTTLLAQQHFENFRDRFANWPVTIEVLSRFKTAKEQQQVIEKIKDGKVDILIGTHKLLSNDVAFKDLGLLIVDEEHRFGVKQKEKIKKLRANVDILTLTATPIPRTLNMAMGGMRDLSIIATPPAKRLAVKTFVRQKDDAIIREAVLREVHRGGQVYFLHNNVETIERTAQDLAKLLPEAQIVTAHGQMRERELERIMSDFYHQRFNVLVCTTIIETGIDIPSANTIIMDRADSLGLAQLHQLRGRVGRSHHQAYAYLLTPNERRITKDAKKRLEAIASLEDLGAGFTLATHDLEIRGAGELLGEEQSGQMSAIGFSLYMDMLDQAVKSLKNGKELSLDDLNAKQTEVDLRIPALLPEGFIFDVNTRLSFYKRIASCENNGELDELQVELIDRYGLLPEPAKNLFNVSKLRLKLAKIGIDRLDAGPNGGSIEFNNDSNIDPIKLIGFLQSNAAHYKMDSGNKIKFLHTSEKVASRFEVVNTVLNELSTLTE